jgi:hypothetical protein
MGHRVAQTHPQRQLPLNGADFRLPQPPPPLAHTYTHTHLAALSKGSGGGARDPGTVAPLHAIVAVVAPTEGTVGEPPTPREIRGLERSLGVRHNPDVAARGGRPGDGKARQTHRDMGVHPCIHVRVQTLRTMDAANHAGPSLHPLAQYPRVRGAQQRHDHHYPNRPQSHHKAPREAAWSTDQSVRAHRMMQKASLLCFRRQTQPPPPHHPAPHGQSGAIRGSPGQSGAVRGTHMSRL